MAKLGTPFDHFLTKDYATPTKEEQVAYLKKHEEEMTKGVEGWNSKITSVQWDWEDLDVEQIGNGTPQGGGWILTIGGGFNEIVDSNFTIAFELKDKKSFPNMNNFYQMQPFRIGGDLYE
ncbi:hypothetical protein OGZ37_13085 [Lactococcus lactis]|uniref:hypothetical protein n=1 Tax=Lactococcus lactis TaxID=1358 RepID=UPI00241865BE|nr:hypothetical protein [Lactococcus lactis]MDG4967491.1 hypothetical protein [Lactococcus lactis]